MSAQSLITATLTFFALTALLFALYVVDFIHITWTENGKTHRLGIERQNK